MKTRYVSSDPVIRSKTTQVCLLCRQLDYPFIGPHRRHRIRVNEPNSMNSDMTTLHMNFGALLLLADFGETITIVMMTYGATLVRYLNMNGSTLLLGPLHPLRS